MSAAAFPYVIKLDNWISEKTIIMLKRFIDICLSLFFILLHGSPLICFWVLLIVGIRTNNGMVILFLMFGAGIFIIARVLLVHFNLLNPDDILARYARLLINSLHMQSASSGTTGEVPDSKIEVIYQRNIFSIATSLTVRVDQAKWPFVNCVTGRPLVLAVSKGEHTVALNDGGLTHLEYKCNITASPAYVVRLLFRSQNHFLLYKRGTVLVEHILPAGERCQSVSSDKIAE
jgi:hypothetical protein